MSTLYIENLEPGDVLLYRGRGLFGRLIQVKTWSRYAHVEIYDGAGMSWASRDGLGVGHYPVRLPELTAILRLRVKCDLVAAREWAWTVEGQGYDWLGLFAFFASRWQGQTNQKQFCSEFAARFLRRGIGAAAEIADGDRRLLDARGLDPWRGRDADAIAPQGFDDSPLFREVADDVD